MATGSKDEVSFRFKRTTRGIDVVSFRRTGTHMPYIEDREIDVTLRPIVNHSVFSENQQLMQEIQQIQSQKTYTFTLTEAHRNLFDVYFRGDYSSDYDDKCPGARNEYLKELQSRPLMDQHNEHLSSRTDEDEGDDTLVDQTDSAHLPSTLGFAAERPAASADASRRLPSREQDDPSLDLHSFGLQNMMAMQQQLLRMQQQMQNMQMAGPRRESEMRVTRTDGTSEDPKSWIKFYELVCSNNQWRTDHQKIIHLKEAFFTGSAAERWYCNRIMDREDATWIEWKESFLQAFSLNRVAAAQMALQYNYRQGRLLEYFYEKDRLLKLAFSDLPLDAFVTLVLLGLPHYMQDTLMSKVFVDKASLAAELNKLAPVTRRTDGPQGRALPMQQSTHVKHRLLAKETETGKRQDAEEQREIGTRAKEDSGRHSHGNKTNFVQKQRMPRANAVTNGPLTVSLPQEKTDKIAACVTPTSLMLHKVLVNGTCFHALLDTGSQRDLVSIHAVKSNKWSMIHDKTNVIAFNSSPATSCGSANVTIAMDPSSELSSVPATEVNSVALVFNDLPYDILIGMPTLSALGIGFTQARPLISSVLGNSERISTLADIERLFPDVLRTDRQPCHTVPFDIENPEQLTASKPYRLSLEKQRKLREALDRMLHEGIIRPSSSKTPAPTIAVDKPDGTVRPCFNYKQHNELTKQDVMPFPIIDDVITSYGGCNFFTKIDLRNGFHHVALTEETRHLTAFVTPFDIYESNRLPFGWKNSPAIFQRLMTRVLGDLLHQRHTHVYVDDCCCGAVTREENERLTYLIIQRLDANGFMINAKKCVFNQSSITFLGRVIDGRTRTTKQETVEKVMRMQPPRDKKGVMQYRGLLGHFRAWIPNMAKLMRPLDMLTRKDARFEWTEECQKSFDTLNRLVTSEPILCQPDWQLDFDLCCDASHYGTGAVLYQKDPKAEKGKQQRLIAFHSYTFTKPEVNFNTTEKECLAVIKACKYFTSYLEGRRCTVHTDHQALSTLLQMKDPKNRLARWQMYLLRFDLTISHRSGKKSTDADAISRLCLDHEPILVAHVLQEGMLSEDDKAFLFKRYHDDSDSGGHGGILRTYMKLRARFGNRWPNLKAEVQQYIRTCPVCQVCKFRYRVKHDYLYLTPHAQFCFHTIALDYGELSKKSDTIKTTRSFIVLVDERSRFLVTKAIRQTSRGLIDFLRSQHFIDSVQRLVCDNGPSFSSQAFQQFCNEKDIKIVHSAPYHPQANGMCERMVQSLKTYMACYASYPGGWKACLAAATNFYNRSYNASIGCTPFFFAYNKNATLPADEELGITVTDETPFTEEQVNARRKREQERVNRNRKLPSFAVGEEIIFRKGNQGKEVYGPVQVMDVVKKDNIPKTLIVGDDRQVVAVRDALPYRRRTGVSFAQALMLGLTLVSVASATTTTFTREPGVLWKKMKEPAVDGYFQVRHEITVNDTCMLGEEHYFTDPASLLNLTAHTQALTSWCHLKLHSVYFQPLKEICDRQFIRYDYKQRTRKNKRQIMAALLGGFAVYSWLGSTGMATEAYYRSQQNSFRIDKAWQDVQELSERFKLQNAVVKETLKQVSSLAAHVASLENANKAAYNNQKRINSWMMRTVLRLAALASDTKQLVSAWKEDALPLSFFTESVKSALHTSEPSSIFAFEAGIPNQCVYDEEKGWAQFEYWLPRIKRDTAFYAANPFVLYTNKTIGNETLTCKMRYTGPRFAIIKGNCVQSVDKEDFQEKRNAFLVEGHACQRKETVETQYWTVSECYQDLQVPTQVKISGEKAYIFCPGKRIQHKPSFYNGDTWLEYDCPNYPFSVPVSESFKVNNFSYEHTEITGSSAAVASPFENALLNENLYPLDGTQEDTIIQRLHELEQQIDTNTPILAPFNGSNGFPLLLVMISLAASLTCVFCVLFSAQKVRKHRRRRRRNRARNNRNDQDTQAPEPEADVLVLGQLVPQAAQD